MSIFSRVTGFFRGVVGGNNSHESEVRDEVHEYVKQEFGEEDELVDIWTDIVEENIDDADELHDFALDLHGADLFRVGWVDDGVNPDERQNARDEFFELMEAYDISRDEFDWDAWRDWYESA